MVNQQMLAGKWEEIQGKLLSRWGQLSGDELDQFDGSVQQLVGMIQRKTGETRERIETALEEMAASDGVDRVVETAKDYARQVRENAGECAAEANARVQETAEHVSKSAKAGYIQAERIVRRRPVESLAACFGVGIVTGLAVGLMLRTK